jgi:4-amino-4-deoxy-L-arabinose transferase-like glycosyltransferase
MNAHAVDAPGTRALAARTRLGAVLALGAIVAVGGLLRFSDLASVRLNPYYDAAVRSMGTSWHAFLYGAFEPGASVATDKPPLDLWLQVAATKLFGFTPFALHLPQALASTAAIVLLYDLVRRGFGVLAGLVGAAAFAVLPAEVLTARSDTMDSLMAALLVLAAWLVVRAAERDRGRELYLAGAVVGLAFEAKLFEALVPVPALTLMYVLAADGPWRLRLGRLGLAGAVAAAVGLAWPAFFALTPAAGRPYPMGSTNGSIWDVVFGYNGLGRLSDNYGGPSALAADHRGLARLVTGAAGRLVGAELIVALGLGAIAVLLGAVGVRRGRVRAAIAAGVAGWALLAVVVLSAMGTFQLRYLETLTPGLAALLGIGAGACALALAARPGRTFSARAAVAAVLLVAALAVPAARSSSLAEALAADGGTFGNRPPAEVAALSRYLTAHRDGTRYEFATLKAEKASTLIAADDEPVLVLAASPFRPLVSVSGLAHAVAAGEVHYVLAPHRSARCVPTPPRGPRWSRRMLAWIETHGIDVTRQAGVARCGVLYRVG